MLKGCDISHYNTNVNYNAYDFVIMKASEGTSLKDSLLDTHYNNIHGSNDGKPDTSKLYGFYHYARPELNKGTTGAQKEADFFLSLVGHHAGYAIFALDWEANALNCDISWAKAWLDRVYEKTGVKPVIYTQGSYTSKLSEIIKGDYGLWVAHWNTNKPTTGVYNTYAFWQYTSTPIDLDYFNGTTSQFKLYCAKNKKSNEEIADEVILGKWGNNPERKELLTKAGYDYNAIQEIVNNKMGK